jgi:hypothetical protein
MEFPSAPEIIGLFGRPSSGKSFFIKSFAYQMAKRGKMKFGLCICPTSFTGDYDYLPKKWVWDEYNEARLEKYVEWLREKRKKIGDKMPPNFVILDDLLGKIDWNSKFWSNWIATFRHTNTTILITAQSIKGRGTSTLLRDCTNRAIMFYTNFRSAVESLYDAYGQTVSTLDSFRTEFRTMTLKKHQAMVYVAGQNSFDETHFSLIAPKVPAFKLDY